jgi:hypothetical protein
MASRTSGRNSASALPTLRLVDVQLRRHDIVVSGEHDGHLRREQFFGVRREPLEPAQLVVKLRARRWVAVRQIEAANSRPFTAASR